MIWLISGLFLIFVLLCMFSLHSGLVFYSIKNSGLNFQLDDKSLINLLRNFRKTKNDHPYVGYLYEMYSMGVLWIVSGIYLVLHWFVRDLSLEFGLIALLILQLAFLATYGGTLISIKSIADSLKEDNEETFQSYFHRINRMTSTMSTCAGAMFTIFMFTLMGYILIDNPFSEMLFHYCLLFTFASGSFMFMGSVGWKTNYVTKRDFTENEEKYTKSNNV